MDYARCRYFYISIVYNVCYTVALMGLLLFWVGAEDPLKPYKPLLKFVTVKTVVFLTFWQVWLAPALEAASQGDLAEVQPQAANPLP